MTEPKPTAAPLAEATGYSDDFSFDEAFRDALDALPPPPVTYPDQLLRTQVVAVGSEIGGIVGLHRMYVRLRRLPDPLALSHPEATAPGGEPPFPSAPGGPLPGLIVPGDRPFPLPWPELPPGLPVAKRVYAVDTVQVNVAESKPPRYVISASGRANTSGWSLARLRRLRDPKVDRDGVYTFELVAHPPTGMVLQVVSPISTILPLVWQPEDGGTVRKIRVVAESNEQVADVEAETATKLKVAVAEGG